MTVCNFIFLPSGLKIVGRMFQKDMVRREGRLKVGGEFGECWGVWRSRKSIAVSQRSCMMCKCTHGNCFKKTSVVKMRRKMKKLYVIWRVKCASAVAERDDSRGEHSQRHARSPLHKNGRRRDPYGTYIHYDIYSTRDSDPFFYDSRFKLIVGFP